MITIYPDHNQAIELGVSGEVQARRIVLDIQDWIDEFGSGGVARVLNRRYGTEQSYYASGVTFGAGKINWDITVMELKYPGIGTCQFQYEVDGVIVRTDTYSTRVEPSLDDMFTVTDAQANALELRMDTLESAHAELADTQAEQADTLASLETTVNNNYTALTNLTNHIQADQDALTTRYEQTVLTVDGIQTAVDNKIWEEDLQTLRDEYDADMVSINTRCSNLEQTVDGFQTTVSNVTSTLNTKADGTSVQSLENRMSTLEQTAERISSTVSATETLYDDLGTRMTTAESNITQTADSITSYVTRAGVKSMIQEFADSIALTVTDDGSTATLNITGDDISAEAQTITLDADKETKLIGDMTVWQNSAATVSGGTIGYGMGSTGVENTVGIHMTDSTGNSEFIATNAGARMSHKNIGSSTSYFTQFYAGSNAVAMQVSTQVSGANHWTGVQIQPDTGGESAAFHPMGASGSTSYGTWYPVDLGRSSNMFRNAYISGSVLSTSDARFKHDVSDDMSQYLDAFDELRPVRFKFNFGEQREHTGFIAQDVCAAMEKHGLDWAGVAKEGRMMLAYQEIIAMNTAAIKRLEKTVEALEARIAELEGRS